MTPAPASLSVFAPPDYDTLYRQFPDADGIPACVPIPATALPEPYRSLLDHTHHMTVTVEQYYGGPVDVRVQKRRRDGDDYARKILLAHHDTGRIVQFGIVQIDLSLLAPHVAEQIVAGDTPLGRVLIQNNVLRRVQPTGYLRITPTSDLAAAFGCDPTTPCYGRLGVIFTDDRPAIEVLEILAPVPADR